MDKINSTNARFFITDRRLILFISGHIEPKNNTNGTDLAEPVPFEKRVLQPLCAAI